MLPAGAGPTDGLHDGCQRHGLRAHDRTNLPHDGLPIWVGDALRRRHELEEAEHRVVRLERRPPAAVVCSRRRETAGGGGGCCCSGRETKRATKRRRRARDGVHAVLGTELDESPALILDHTFAAAGSFVLEAEEVREQLDVLTDEVRLQCTSNVLRHTKLLVELLFQIAQRDSGGTVAADTVLDDDDCRGLVRDCSHLVDDSRPIVLVFRRRKQAEHAPVVLIELNGHHRLRRLLRRRRRRRRASRPSSPSRHEPVPAATRHRRPPAARREQGRRRRRPGALRSALPPQLIFDAATHRRVVLGLLLLRRARLARLGLRFLARRLLGTRLLATAARFSASFSALIASSRLPSFCTE